jgi:2-oxo-3-hexenedioate decarboxylase/2-keto-4-pentenoate hydratase
MWNASLVILPPRRHTPLVAGREGAIDEQVRDAGAGRLREAARTGIPVAPLTSEFPELSVPTAYAIQRTLVDERLAAGATVRGHKVGLTSKAMQEMLGVTDPDYGHLLDDMFFGSGTSIDIGRFLQPRVEVEIAFLLRDPVAGPGVTLERVLAATESVAPALEIIDSRIADWRIALADTIADNASSAGVVLGAWSPVTGDLDLTEVTAELSINDEHVASGKGADVLGHPAEAVAWLANALADFGVSLEPGHVIMPGSCTKAFDVRAGDHVEAVYSQLGTVSATFASPHD